MFNLKFNSNFDFWLQFGYLTQRWNLKISKIKFSFYIDIDGPMSRPISIKQASFLI